jgi:hypothetical protein
MGGVAKEYITKLGCEKYYHRVTYLAPLEMLLPIRNHEANIIMDLMVGQKAPYAYTRPK